MPRDPLLPESGASVRPRSPDTVGGSERKRRRKVLSCYDCRRRKLQCDRALPACGRCTKAGQATNCLYLDEVADTPTRIPDTVAPSLPSLSGDGLASRTAQAHSGDLLSRLEYQDRRIKELEAALSASYQNQSQHSRAQKMLLTPESIVDTNAAEISATDRETMLLRGKSFKTQFHGISHPGSMIAYIPQLSLFMKEILETFPGLAKIRQDLHALEDRTEFPSPKHQVTTEDDMKAMLPSKAEADELVKLYLDNFDGVYHIIHIPSFLQEYEEMWKDVSTVRPHFVALLLAMMATVQCLRSMEPWLYTANSSSARDKALLLVRACEDWLLTQSQKHVTVIDFQIRFLINLAKLVNGSKFKRTWTDAGTLLRFCMAAGLHRNPELIRKPTSTMDKEMRRRIWYAAAEWELESSFARGMISMPWPQQSDYMPPSNLNDDELEPDMQQLPARRPSSDFTSTSYLAIANESFMLRYTLNANLNNVRQAISFDDIKRYTEELEIQLQAIPQWNESASMIPHALLSITLNNYLLVMHDRQIRNSSSAYERNFSKLVILDAAKKIIDAHKALSEKGCHVLLLLRHDQMRAAFSVCHVFAMSDPQADSFLYETIAQQASYVIGEAVALIGEKIERLGCEQRQLLLVLAASAFMRTKQDPNQKFAHMQEAVDKVMRHFYRILACQEDVPSAISSGPPTGKADPPETIVDYLHVPSTAMQKPALNGGSNDPALLDFDAIAAWTFDDWTFNPGEFETFDGAI